MVKPSKSTTKPRKKLQDSASEPTPIAPQASSSSISIPYNFMPRDYQLNFFKAIDSGKYNRFFLRWCRRSGKDKTCIAVLARLMMERVGNYYYLYPSYSQGRKAMWEGKDKEGFPFLGHIPYEIRKPGPSNGTNNNEMKIDLINGSTLRVMGTENINSLVGTNPVCIVFSEWALQSPGAWDFLRPILEQNNGIAIFNGTPRGKNHMFDMEANNKKFPNWYFSEVQTLWTDLPHYYQIVTLDQVGQARSEGMTEELIEQEYGASYSSGAKGNYYSDQIIVARESGRIGNFPYDDKLWVDTFWDIGYSDSTAVWFKQQDGRANIFIDYYENNTKDIQHYVEVLRQKGYRFRTHYLPHDAVQKHSGFCHRDVFRTLCQQAGISSDVIVAKKPSVKQQAIDAVRGRFSSYFFNEPLVGKAVTMLSLYHRQWNRQTEVFLDNPVHDWTSHCADALSTEALSASMQLDLMYGTRPTIITDFDPIDFSSDKKPPT